ncbi:hypothetical protein, partial [Escherichia coli]|uniref:hypothetical protein n=1 Tax=Escherichia coli TaxID=562 RepID=UPI001BDBA87E
LRDEWSHFLPESITDLPLVARHTSPSEIIILYYLTIPFGIGSKHGGFQFTGSLENNHKITTIKISSFLMRL